MAEWSARRTRNPKAPGSSPALATLLTLTDFANFVLGRPEFKSPAMPANSQLVASYQLGLNYFLLRATSIDPTQ